MSELLKINVNDHTEKKNGLTYLSWAWAWAEVLKIDPQATWHPESHANGLPVAFMPDGSAMVCVHVTIKGHTKCCFLPVMNHRNQAIKNPDSFAINTAMMRCLAKAIAMHGLGLYIYAGEDLPEDAEQEKKAEEKPAPVITSAKGIGDDLPEEQKQYLADIAIQCRDLVNEGKPRQAYELIKAQNLEADQEVWLSRQMDSRIRSAIKASKPVPL